MKKVQFTETVLRDANQSLIATRLPYDKFEPILDRIDKAGFYSVECWGGATFDVFSIDASDESMHVLSKRSFVSGKVE